ncbi:hypothetical protein VIBRN418_12225 [Vibrio sp. N418]|nr:hypothetical protein VIBRN418_12225 [Vibrio sp. N418]
MCADVGFVSTKGQDSMKSLWLTLDSANGSSKL